MMNVNAELFVMRVLAGYDPICGYELDHLSFWKSEPTQTAFRSLAENFNAEYNKVRLKSEGSDFFKGIKSKLTTNA